MSAAKGSDSQASIFSNQERIDHFFPTISSSTQKSTSTVINTAQSVIESSDSSRDSLNPKALFDSLEKIDKNEDIKSTLMNFAKAYECLYKSQEKMSSQIDNINVVVSDISLSSSQLADHVNGQITKLEDDLAVHKDITEDRLLSLKVAADIRHSKHFLKIFMRDEKRMNDINKVNVRNEAKKVLNELGLDLRDVRIANAETRYERRSLFGPVRFIKHMVVTFNDFCTAEKLFMDFIKSKGNTERTDESMHQSTSNFLNKKYYLELPSSFEMRKVMSVCKELKADENIASVFYASDCVRVVMKKNDPNDEKEIPKKFDVTNLHQVDKMRNKFVMKNADIPAKQLFNRDYWSKKKENIKKKNNVVNNNGQQSKRRLENSFEGHTNNGNAKKGKKDSNKKKYNNLSNNGPVNSFEKSSNSMFDDTQ